MCGVISLVCERERGDLGRIAANLLKMLEYRGYDSTGAAIQAGTEVELRKGVGAPSVMTERLGIDGLSGRILCGQVRWATFGAVDELNAQPHVVGCRVRLYGAHNGNVTNCDDLKAWLRSEGHDVRSDNDGEMVVHTIEHAFADELLRLSPGERDHAPSRHGAMRAAIVAAAARLVGSYAAVVVDPATGQLWSIKQGSSLYFGVGSDARGTYTLSSSDLSAVLRMTHVLVPLSQGELVEHDAAGYRVFRLQSGEELERHPVRSRLRAQDAALRPGFSSFMEQEIADQETTCRDVAELFAGGPAAVRALAGVPIPDGVVEGIERLRHHVRDDELRSDFHALVDSPPFASLRAARRPSGDDRRQPNDAGLLAHLGPHLRGPADAEAVAWMDLVSERRDVETFDAAVDRFVEACEHGHRVLAICCGSSFHAAKMAATFWNELARVPLVPLLPGEFRAQYGRSLADGDVVVAVSQSGETKDLIDVIDDVTRSGHAVTRVALVNNLNSTLAQEKSDLVIPLRCGPEIAVPATKSVMNQLVVLHGLALRLARRRFPNDHDLAARAEALPAVANLVRSTLEATAADVDRMARELFLAPSLHILGTRLSPVAMEGALKIREVVLNHTQGYEASEFKHGPNTILGFNTVFGPREVEGLLARAVARGTGELRGLLGTVESDYPLLFVTGPDRRDVALTVSQINTHKIRGASIFVVAEENADLRQAAEKPPAGRAGYRSGYVALPRSDDPMLTAYSATVVLQRLALRMSELKAAYLDDLGVVGHGVHPDVPKNVSKSITVD